MLGASGLDGARPSARYSSLPWRSGPRVVIPPAFVAACQGAWLAGRPPGPSAPTAPARTGWHPAAVAGGPPRRGRRGAAGRVVVPACWPHGRHLQDRGRRQHGTCCWARLAGSGSASRTAPSSPPQRPGRRGRSGWCRAHQGGVGHPGGRAGPGDQVALGRELVVGLHDYDGKVIQGPAVDDLQSKPPVGPPS
jgi:hypothetical protein